MKTAKSIIEHLKRHPQNSKVLEIACYEKVKALLPPHLAKAVLFIYRKNHTLYFVLNHPGMKMEFNYMHTLIKNLLKKLKEFDENCQNLEITEVKSFVSNKISPPAATKEPQIARYYREKAKGNFENRAKSKELREIFDAIKEMLANKS